MFNTPKGRTENYLRELITPEEAYRLSHQNGSQDIIEAKAIADYYVDASHENNPYKLFSTDWEMISLIAAVYSAGRIQGIREERLKAKLRANGINPKQHRAPLFAEMIAEKGVLG